MINKKKKPAARSRKPKVVAVVENATLDEVVAKASEIKEISDEQLEQQLDEKIAEHAKTSEIGKKLTKVQQKKQEAQAKKEAKLILSPPVKKYTATPEELRQQCHSMYLEQVCNIQAARRVYRTGCVGLDIASGQVDPLKKNGGFPELLIFELYGPTGKRKTSMFEHLAYNILMDDPNNIVMCLCTEDPDAKRLKGMGMPMDRYQILGLYNPATPDVKRQLGEVALMDLVVASMFENVKLIGVDSLKALISILQMYEKGGVKDNKIKPFEDDDVAIRAKLVEKLINRILFARRSAILGFLNQVSDRIPDARKDRFIIALGDHDNTPAGRFKEAISPVRLRLEGKPLFVETELGVEDRKHKPQAGIRNIITIRKNRWGAPNIKIAVDFNFNTAAGPGKGFYDNSEELFYYGRKAELITQNGVMYTFQDGQTARGRDACLDLLDADKALSEEIYLKLIEAGPAAQFGARPGEKGQTKKVQITEDAPVEGTPAEEVPSDQSS